MCYCIDVDIGATHKPEVFDAVRTRPFHEVALSDRFSLRAGNTYHQIVREHRIFVLDLISHVA